MADNEIKSINGQSLCDATARAAIEDLNSSQLTATLASSTSGLLEVLKDANGKLWAPGGGTDDDRDANDVTVNGKTVTIPAGRYAVQVQKSVASGTLNKPAAVKGDVSNHSVVITPSVTYKAGYITGNSSTNTKTGDPVTVTAAELASGTLELTGNTTEDGVTCVGYEKVKVVLGTEFLSYATELYRTYYGAENLPDTVTVYAPNCHILRATFSNVNSGAKVVNVTAGTVTNLRDGFVGSSSASSKNSTTEIVNLNCTFSNCNFQQGFNHATALREINGELDLTGGSSYETMFGNSSNIEKLTFKPNSISLNIKFTGLTKLTDDTLISIANGLDGTAEQTLTLSSTAPTGGVAPFSRCDTIMGTVSNGVFAANTGGSVSLTSFIRDTKGWTLAGA